MDKDPPDNHSLNILDGVRPIEIMLGRDHLRLKEEITNPDLGLVDRLESLEDIISLDIGDSSLTRARSLERSHDLRKVYLKYEGDNPTGTQKDRIAFAQVYDALRRGYEVIVAATCGNYGVAVAYAAFFAGIKCQIYIPASYHTERANEMQSWGAEVIYLPGSYEEVVEASSKLALEKELYDANPGGQNTPIQLQAYAQIAWEIYDQLRDAPKYLAFPVSNGTLLAGVYRGFVSLYKRGKTSRIPHFVAGSSAYKNPIINSFLKNHSQTEDLAPHKIRETKVNEPLINWHSFDGDEALYALRETQGYAAHISDRAMLNMSSFLSKNDGLRVLPASTAGLVAFLKLHQATALPNDRFVCLITARR
ncbi:MAG: pyridoxal-phosphate dependent enzyme [Bacteroidota bacterium]